MRVLQLAISSVLLAFCLACGVTASQPHELALTESALDAVFAGADAVDLSRCRSAAVVALREVVKIPAPTETVLVKTFRRESLPEVLRPVFANPQVSGVTISGKYIAIIATEFSQEYQDILQHELVHAYITMASPRPLPFWFQEGSAVHFSIDKGRKFYGKPADERVGVTVGKTVELPDVYKNKLQNFHYLISKVGKRRFYDWYREAVVTGVVNPRPLLGLSEQVRPVSYREPISTWVLALAGSVIIGISVAGYYVLKRERDLW